MMWVMTTKGFFSAVEKPEDRAAGTLTIRARNEQDINALADMIPNPDAQPFQLRGYSDYPWRLRCTVEEWAVALAKLAFEIDYTNFKDAVKARQGKRRANIYSAVWGVLLRLEARASRSTYDYDRLWDDRWDPHARGRNR